VFRRRISGLAEIEHVASENRPWHEGLVLVCYKCDGAVDASPADVLKATKQLTREQGRKAFRTTSSGCLDLCPANGVAIAVAVDGEPAKCFVASSVDALRSLERILQ
jgi:hypothetical protein